MTPRERVPLDWARTQNDLGIALTIFGRRESGTAKLEEAVAAFREALKEWTRERVPLDWAMTQNNLGTALLPARGARERDGEARRGGRRLSAGTEGTDPRAHAARMGHDPDIIWAMRYSASGSARAGRRSSKRPSLPFARR